MTPLPAADYISDGELRRRADEFLEEYGQGADVYPVDIEDIVDVILGIDVIPVQHLNARYEIDGSLSVDRSAIYVDEQLYPFNIPGGGLAPLSFRYRFTLAHELGHWYLHREIYEAAEEEIDSLADWHRVIAGMPDRDRSRFEYQAYTFGGLVLVQEEPLAREIDQAIQWARDEKGYEVDLQREEDCIYLAEHIGRKAFAVSRYVILKRGNYDGHWPFR